MIKLKGVLTKEECKEIVSKLKDWQEGGSKLGKSHKDNQEQVHSELSAFVSHRIQARPEIKMQAFIKRMITPRFNQYKKGQKYGRHVDFFMQEGVRTDWSMTLFLTDDYEGGELVIEDEPVKLEAGDMVLYHSGQIHEVKPVTKGERIAAICWAESIIEDKYNRELVAKLAKIINESETHVTELSEIYNNLMKKWSR